MTSQNINIIFKRKQSIGNNGVGSIGGASAMSYSPSSHTMPTLFQHRDSFVHQRELESAFCSDLVCCGTPVRDLHELLHHYEEHHHAPIEEETEPKEETEDNTTTEDDIVMDDLDSPFPLPTQPHELAALTSSPLLRKNNLNTATTTTAVINPSTSPPTATTSTLDTTTTPLNISPSTTTSSTRTTLSPHQQHTEEILRQALPALINHPSVINGSSLQESLDFFKTEALYQTCDDGQDKPYKCPINGCDKAYKNPNGLKYHQMHGHSEEDKLSEAERDAQKPYMCTIGYCNKRYKNLNGLKYHIEHSHIAKLKQYTSPLQQNSAEQILFSPTASTASNNNEAWRP